MKSSRLYGREEKTKTWRKNGGRTSGCGCSCAYCLRNRTHAAQVAALSADETLYFFLYTERTKEMVGNPFARRRRRNRPDLLGPAEKKPTHLKKRWFVAVVREEQILPDELFMKGVLPLPPEVSARRQKEIEALKH